MPDACLALQQGWREITRGAGIFVGQVLGRGLALAERGQQEGHEQGLPEDFTGR